MVFHTDKQRKAVMAKLKGSSRSQTKPTIIGKLRKRFRPTPKELAKQRGERIKEEARQLEIERGRVRQLELEAQLESERERVKAREEIARAKLRKIDISRREKTLAGKVLKVERRVVARGIEIGKKAIIGAKIELKKKPRRRAKPKAEEPGFFGI